MDRNSGRLVLAGIVLLLAAPLTFGQVSLKVGAGVGVLLPMGDLAGETAEYYAGTNYGLSTGYDVQAKARIGLVGFTIVGGLEYGSLSNDGGAEAGGGKVETSQSILTAKVGPEFSFAIPAAPITPYLGANVAWHSISGKTTFNGIARVPSGEFELKTASRFGFGINGGVQIDLGPAMTLDIGAEYAFINPMTKEWTPVDPITARVSSYKALNDEKDPLYVAGNTDHFISGARSISTFSVTASVLFGF